MRARPGGGLNQGFGQFGEHLDESALQQAGAQKTLSQAAADPKQAATAAAAAAQNQAQATGQDVTKPPRAVGSIKDELITRPLHDIWQEVKSFFSLNTWLGIKSDTQTPEEKQRKIATHKRWQQLNEEQQALVKQRYQEELKKKEIEEEQKQQRKQMEEQKKKEQPLILPSSPKKGPIGPASGMSSKKRTTTLLQQQRQMLSQASGSN